PSVRSQRPPTTTLFPYATFCRSAAVNGPAVAGGAGLVTACDVAFAARSARFGYTEARIGFVAALVSVMLVRQVGEKHARELLLGDRKSTRLYSSHVKISYAVFCL